jgi:hypothetical protein
VFYEKRMAQEVQGDSLGDEFKGYIFKITGGNDKQGFPMMQGVLVQGRVRLLLRKGIQQTQHHQCMGWGFAILTKHTTNIPHLQQTFARLGPLSPFTQPTIITA